MIEKIVSMNHRFKDYAILEFRNHFVIRNITRSRNIQRSKLQEPFFLIVWSVAAIDRWCTMTCTKHSWPVRSWHNKRGDTLLGDVSGTKNVLLRCLGDSGHSWSSGALECIPPSAFRPVTAFLSFYLATTTTVYYLPHLLYGTGIERTSEKTEIIDRDSRGYVGHHRYRFSNGVSSSFCAKDR